MLFKVFEHFLRHLLNFHPALVQIDDFVPHPSEGISCMDNFNENSMKTRTVPQDH